MKNLKQLLIEKYEQMKENIRNTKRNDEKDELNGNIRKNIGNTQS